MNRVSTSFLDCEVSGEREALEWILKKLSARSKEIIIFDCGGHYGASNFILENKSFHDGDSNND